MLTRLLVRLAYHLDASPRYGRVKEWMRDLLENPRSGKRACYDLFMTFLVTVSVVLFIYEIRSAANPWIAAFERITVAILVAEYLLRLWLCNDSRRVLIESFERAEFLRMPFRLGAVFVEIARKKLLYLRTPLAVVDLLAILPTYGEHPLLQVFILFRLIKLFRYVRSANEMVSVFSQKRFELVTLGFFIGFVLFFASTAMYVFEHELGQIGDFRDALYWAFITLFTVGYGDITPHTPEGRVVTFLLVLSGVGLVAYLTSILLSAFHEKLDELRENRVLAETERHRNLVVVGGFGRMGRVVARKLCEDRTPFIVIDRERERVEHARRVGYLAIHGDASSDTLLRGVGILDRVGTVLSLTGDDVLNVYITLTARHLNPGVNIISRANKPDSVRKLEQAGANHIIQPFEAAGLTVAEYVGQPVAFEAIYGMVSGERHLRMEAVRVGRCSGLVGRPLGDVHLEESRLVLFGVIGSTDGKRGGSPGYALRKGRFYFNPSQDFVLQGSDVLVLFGHEVSLAHFKEHAELDGGRIRSS